MEMTSSKSQSVRLKSSLLCIFPKLFVTTVLFDQVLTMTMTEAPALGLYTFCFLPTKALLKTRRRFQMRTAV